MSENVTLECKQIFALLSRYIDAELPAETCDEISKHIAACPPCVEFVDSLKKTVALCRRHELSDQPGPLPEDARRQLRTAYEKLIEARGKP